MGITSERYNSIRLEAYIELFITVVLFGLTLYELYTGEAITRYGSSARTISRRTSPVKYWLLLAFQVAFGTVALLIWLDIIKF